MIKKYYYLLHLFLSYEAYRRKNAKMRHFFHIKAHLFLYSSYNL